MENEKFPLVSIGLPVFNGEKSLSQALETLLNQDYRNLEIIISDNGSTDRTPAICEEFLQKDARVKYYRSSENLGSNWNFNRVVELSSGKYFMWAAHDDLRDLTFVRVCIEKLEQFPKAVLCHTYTELFIQNRKERLCVTNLDSFDGVTDLVERYRETLKHFSTVAIYGVYRLSAMKKTHMLAPSIASDIAFIQELSIYGNFVQVPQILFSYIGREKWNTVHNYKFSGKDKALVVPSVHSIIPCHWARVAHSELTLSLKLRLWWLLIVHEVGQSILKVFIKVCRILCPSSFEERLACAIYTRWMKGPNRDGSRFIFGESYKTKGGVVEIIKMFKKQLNNLKTDCSDNFVLVITYF